MHTRASARKAVRDAVGEIDSCICGFFLLAWRSYSLARSALWDAFHDIDGCIRGIALQAWKAYALCVAPSPCDHAVALSDANSMQDHVLASQRHKFETINEEARGGVKSDRKSFITCIIYKVAATAARANDTRTLDTCVKDLCS